MHFHYLKILPAVLGGSGATSSESIIRPATLWATKDIHGAMRRELLSARN